MVRQEALIQVTYGAGILDVNVVTEGVDEIDILPLIRDYKAAVIGLTLDDSGIPKTAEKRPEIARTSVEQAESLGIPREDIIIDPLALGLIFFGSEGCCLDEINKKSEPSVYSETPYPQAGEI